MEFIHGKTYDSHPYNIKIFCTKHKTPLLMQMGFVSIVVAQMQEDILMRM